jgi:hypothetical protein
MEELSEKEEYKETLSKEEISRIKDCDLREIRHKYWLKKTRLLGMNIISLAAN